MRLVRGGGCVVAVRFEWNRNALYDVRRSDGVVAQLDSIAEGVCDTANSIGKGTYSTGSQQGVRRPQGRWRATVVTADYRAMIDNAKHQTLIRSIPS